MRGNKIVTLIFLLFLLLNISVNKIVLATGKNFTVSNKWNIVQFEYNMPGWILVLTSNGDVYGWGDNEFGFLGQGDKHDRSTPNLIKPLKNIKRIAVRLIDSIYTDNVFVTKSVLYGYTCFVLDSKGKIWSWGLVPENLEIKWIDVPKLYYLTRDISAKDIFL